MLGWRDFHRMTLRDIALQAGVVLLVIGIAVSAYFSAKINLAELGITSGFNFLNRDTGWGYSFSLLDRSIDDTYRRTLFIGFLNTVFVGAVSIFLATLLGFLIGTMRDSLNPGLKAISSLYVQVFRNVPLILQIVFLYSILIHFPSPKQALTIGELVFMSNRGIMVPVLTLPLWSVAAIVAGAEALALVLVRSKMGIWQALLIWLGAVAAAFAIAILTLVPEGGNILSVPYLKGLKFREGLTLSVELVAMILGIVLYSAAYIGEVVRGGLDEVPRGLVEAGKSLGLGRFAVWWTIKVPMALRSIIPPLGNQWIFTMKATTVGVAIGFSDLFYIVSTSITQSGQTLELIAILMGAFLLVNFIIARLVSLINARLALKGYGS